jgi:hypothetical protein
MGILEHLEILLQGMVTNPEIRLKDLSLSTASESQIALMLEKEAIFDFDLVSCN